MSFAGKGTIFLLLLLIFLGKGGAILFPPQSAKQICTAAVSDMHKRYKVTPHLHYRTDAAYVFRFDYYTVWFAIWLLSACVRCIALALVS
jgi:hypothetical protein